MGNLEKEKNWKQKNEKVKEIYILWAGKGVRTLWSPPCKCTYAVVWAFHKEKKATTDGQLHRPLRFKWSMSLPCTGLLCTEQEGLLIRWNYATVRDRLTFGKNQNPFPKPHMDTRRENCSFQTGCHAEYWCLLRCEPCSKKETAEFTKHQGKCLTWRNTQQHIWKVLSNYKMLSSWKALPHSKGHLLPVAPAKQRAGDRWGCFSALWLPCLPPVLLTTRV